jgi:hypothetical protein
MAHFAELDKDNIVVGVTVVDNSHVPSDKHADGETWCKDFFNKQDTTYKQTSYNHNFRKQYAGIGFTYDAAKDEFVAPKPYASWTLDSSNDWQAPITKPDDGKGYRWDEEAYQSDNSTGWVEQPEEE